MTDRKRKMIAKVSIDDYSLKKQKNQESNYVNILS